MTRRPLFSALIDLLTTPATPLCPGRGIGTSCIFPPGCQEDFSTLCRNVCRLVTFADRSHPVSCRCLRGWVDSFPGLVDLPELEGGEGSLCTGLIVVDTRAELAKLVLQTPCMTPNGSEFGEGIDLSGQMEERHNSPKGHPVQGECIRVNC